MKEREPKWPRTLAESCVESPRIADLPEIAGRNSVDLSVLLPMMMTCGAINGSGRLRRAIGAFCQHQTPDPVIVTHGAIGADLHLLHLREELARLSGFLDAPFPRLAPPAEGGFFLNRRIPSRDPWM